MSIAWPRSIRQIPMKQPAGLALEAPSQKAEAGILLIILIVALGLRIAYLQVTQIWHAPPEYDGIEYDILATHLLNGQGFSMTMEQPYGFRPPGLPFFLALLYAVFGHSYLAIRLANVALSTLTCLPIYLFTKRVWSWEAGIITSLGIAAHPLLIYFNGLIYPEPLMLFLIAVVLLLGIYAIQSRRIEGIVVLGLVSGYLVYLRPNLIIFGLAQTVQVWLSYKTIKQRLLASAVLVGIVVLTIIPWSIRNWLAFHKVVWMSTNGGVTLWAGNNPLADGGWVEPSPATWLGPDPPVDLRGWPELTEVESDEKFQAEAINWIRSHPAEFLSLLPKKLVRSLSLSIGNEARQIDLPGTVYVAYLLFLILSLVGLVLSLARWRDLVALHLLIGVSTLTTLIYYGSTRQSSLLILPMVIFASLAIERALSLVFARFCRDQSRGSSLQ